MLTLRKKDFTSQIRSPRVLSEDSRTVQAVCPGTVQCPIFLAHTGRLFCLMRTFPTPQCSARTCAAICPDSVVKTTNDTC